MFKRNANIGRELRISSWRRSALAIWRTAYDPSIYTWDEFDVAPAQAYMERVARETGLKITLTHFVSKAVAEMIRRHPEMNVLRRGGSLYPRDTIDLSYTVASDGRGEDLGAAIVYDAASKSMAEISRELQPVVKEVKTHRDPRHQGFKKVLSLLPHRLRCLVLDVTTWILYDLNLWSPIFGLPRNPFGCVLITNIGSLGLVQGFAALVPAMRIPMVIAVGAVQDRAIVREGRIEAARMLGLYFTVDHRVVDAVPAGYMSQTLKKIFADPERELESGKI
jgi:pyruvate dehydrogenase E2 component (dihydrolipoamide acetyltransferase)